MLRPQGVASLPSTPHGITHDLKKTAAFVQVAKIIDTTKLVWCFSNF